MIGNSLAGIHVLEEVRKVEADSELTVIPLEEHFPYYKSLLFHLLSKDFSEKEIFYQSADYFEKLKINFLFNQKVAKVSCKRNRVILEDKQILDYDYLLLTDSDSNQFPEIKGNYRNGVFGCRRLCDIKQIISGLSLAETVIIQSESILGLKLAWSLKKRGKEVIWVAPDQHFLFSQVDSQTSQRIRSLMLERDIRMIEQNSIAEILGNGEVKAVRLHSGKVLAGEMVIWAEAKADLKLFKDSELRLQENICVNPYFQTNFSNVYAINGVCDLNAQYNFEEYDSYSATLTQEAQVVLSSIQGKFMDFNVPLRMKSLNVDGLSIHLMGETREKDSLKMFSKYDEKLKSYKKIFTEGGCMRGCVLINCSEDKQRMENLIRNLTPIEGKECEILEIDSNTVRQDPGKEMSIETF